MLGLTGVHVGQASAAPGCGPVSISTVVPAPVPVLSWAENVGYDKAGNLWVSRTQQNVIDKYDPRGRHIGAVHIDAPGAVRLGPDGKMFANSGDSPANMMPILPRQGRIVSFDPAGPSPAVRVVTRGLGMPNGLAVADDGTMYVGDSRLGVVRVRRNGSIDQAWTARAPKNLAPNATVNGTGMNGVVVLGDAVYVTMTSSLSGRILRVPIKNPAAATVAADLTAPIPGTLDDLVVLGKHTLAVTSALGTVGVVNLATGGICTVSTGHPLTSLAHTPNGRSVVAGSEDGSVLKLTGRIFGAPQRPTTGQP